jgi:vitamin B12 transporter
MRAGLLLGKKRIFSFLSVAVLILATAAVPAWAQDDGEHSDNAGEVTLLEEIVVEGQAPSPDQPEQDLAAFGQILLLDEIPGIAMCLSEALENAIGLQVRDFGGLGKLSTVTMRGFSSRDVLVMLDGVPLNSIALGGVDLSDIPLASIDRIEILRGTEAALFGNNSAAGIINIVRRTDTGGARYALNAGSYGYLSGDLSLSQKQDDFGLFARIYGTTFRGDFDFLNDNGTSLDACDDFIDTRRNNEYDSWGFFGGFNAPSGKWDLHFDIDMYRARKGVPGLIAFPTPDAAQYDHRRLVHFGGTDDNIAGGMGEFNFGIDFLETTRSFDDPSGGATGFPVSSHWREMQLGTDIRYAEFIADDHYFTIGAEWGKGSFHPRNASSTRRDEFGFYLRDEISIGNSLLIPALRFDDITGAGSRLSPKIGWRMELGDGIILKANWGRAFRAPTFEELYRQEGFIIGNPDLLPEKSWSADVGFVYETGDIRLEADYYEGRATDLIEYVLGSGHRFRPLNFGKAHLSGIEGSMSWELDESLRLEANAAYTHAIDKTMPGATTYGRQIPGHPKWDAYAGLLYDYPAGDFSAHVTAYFAAGRFLTAANTKELADDLSFNIGFTSALGRGTSISFEMKNLFDEDLMDVRGFPLPGRTFAINLIREE